MSNNGKEAFLNKYKHADKIWSGRSFIDYPDLKQLLAEMPVSPAANPTKNYTHRYSGNRDIIFGEILHNLLAYEGFMRDKTNTVKECSIRPVINRESVIIEFDLDYKTKYGDTGSTSFEVIRNGERNYLFFIDRYRPG
ncbi:MAG: hypothetical protein FJ134_07350 [Deltaproteobacteria bacterium]|nr:hypothetical protein [Deltaproteobacteria bacterium]